MNCVLTYGKLDETEQAELATMLKSEGYKDVAALELTWEQKHFQRGQREGLCAAVLDLCEVLQIRLLDSRRAVLARLDVPALQALRAYLKEHRAWPLAQDLQRGPAPLLHPPRLAARVHASAPPCYPAPSPFSQATTWNRRRAENSSAGNGSRTLTVSRPATSMGSNPWGPFR